VEEVEPEEVVVLETPEAQARIAEGGMKLVGGIFDIASGHVRFLP
jgi:hypothetical protein